MNVLKQHSPLHFTFISAFLFVLLFYRQAIGINLLLFEIAVLMMLDPRSIIEQKKMNSITILAGAVVTGLAVVLHHSVLSILVNLLSFSLLIGALIHPSSRSMISVVTLGISSVGHSFPGFFQETENSRLKFMKLKTLWKIFKITAIPLIVLLLFMQMYRNSSPFFESFYNSIFSKFEIFWQRLMDYIDTEFMVILFLGLVTAIFLFIRRPDHKMIAYDQTANDHLNRIRKSKGNFKFPALKYEFRSALLLTALLNILLLIVNVLDVYWVWFSFEWNGEYLKQFVHEGTYLLIFSIFISIALALFYFRGNLNHYKQNKWLKISANAWLAQNVILAISVAIRNLWYIHYFALAYKRIAVLFFLTLIIFGLVTVMLKVNRKKSPFYLLRLNAYSFYLSLLVAALFNWDVIISNYNFAHYRTSFVHLDFLATMSDSALPILEKSEEELSMLKKEQERLFHFKEDYMSAEKYSEIIHERKTKFLEKYAAKGFLSWNYAEYVAYQKLIQKE